MMFLRDALPVMGPLLVVVTITAAVVLYLWKLEGELPIFDLGVITLAVTALYSAIPLAGFLLSGMHWTPISYLTLYLWNPGPAEVGRFATRHAVYVCAFASAYVWFRGRAPVRCGPTRELPPSGVAAIVMSGAALLAYFWLVKQIFGIDFHPTYNEVNFAATAAWIRKAPYVLVQVSQNLYAILFLVKLCGLLWLMAHWHLMRWRIVCLAWLAGEAVLTVTRMGARTWFVLLLMAAGLLYHRLVKPLPFARAAILATALLAGALVYGIARDLGSNFSGLRVIASSVSSRWTTMNEFQAVFGISYDLYARQAAGMLGPIPPQLYVSEIIQLVPSQLLPFAKVDPCMGYPVVDGVGVGCVLGVTAQALLGLDRIELAMRGLILGLLFAILHRWYVRNQDGYWATMFYLCMCLWCYYTFRGSTFVFLYYIVYRFVPLVVGMRIAQSLVRRGVRAAHACGV